MQTNAKTKRQDVAPRGWGPRPSTGLPLLRIQTWKNLVKSKRVGRFFFTRRRVVVFQHPVRIRAVSFPPELSLHTAINREDEQHNHNGDRDEDDTGSQSVHYVLIFKYTLEVNIYHCLRVLVAMNLYPPAIAVGYLDHFLVLESVELL